MGARGSGSLHFSGSRENGAVIPDSERPPGSGSQHGREQLRRTVPGGLVKPSTALLRLRLTRVQEALSRGVITNAQWALPLGPSGDPHSAAPGPGGTLNGLLTCWAGGSTSLGGGWHVGARLPLPWQTSLSEPGLWASPVPGLLRPLSQGSRRRAKCWQRPEKGLPSTREGTWAPARCTMAAIPGGSHGSHRPLFAGLQSGVNAGERDWASTAASTVPCPGACSATNVRPWATARQ